MVAWLKYFFLGFFSNERSRQCQWRSLGNAFLGALVAFAIVVCGLTWGYQASFGTVYDGAEDYKTFLYDTMEDLDFKIVDGEAVGSAQINTYADGGEHDMQLVVDLRDVYNLFDDFTLTCKSATRPEISYEEYLSQPAYIQQEYTEFKVGYTGKPVDVKGNYEKYYSYIKGIIEDKNSAMYNENVAAALKELDETKPYNYYEQIYLLYAFTYYPTLELSEYGARIPTIHGYYYEQFSNDAQGQFLALFKDRCYVAFHYGSKALFFVGNYGLIDDLSFDGNVQEAADMLMEQVFRSSSGADYLMYIVNVFGMFILLIIVWIALMAVVRFYSKKREIEATFMLGGAAQLVGSFFMGCGLITALISFVVSFFLSQTLTFYLAALIFITCLIMRTVMYLHYENKELYEDEDE